MKICMFSNLFPPVVSGSSTQSYALARELVKRGHEVCVISAHVNDASKTYEVADGVHIYRLPAFRLPKMPIALNFPWLSLTFTVGNQKRINEIIDRHEPDVLHLHNHMFDLAFSAVRMKRRFQLPLVTTLHTVIKHKNPIYNLLLYPIDRVFLRFMIIKNNDHLIYPDVNIEDYAAEAFKVVTGHGTIIPYGVKLPDAPVDDVIEELRDKHDLHDKRVILSLGHLHDIRNRHDLIRALPYVLEEYPKIVLLIVGTVGTESPRMLARELGVEHAVIFAGAVPHAHIPAYLSLADMEAHWLNQEEPEKTSLGIASLEAMSAGTTILAAANPDTYGRDILQHEKNIVIVQPNQPETLANTIIDLLNDEARRVHIGEQARRTIEENFSWEKVCELTLDVYAKTISSSA